MAKNRFVGATVGAMGILLAVSGDAVAQEVDHVLANGLQNDMSRLVVAARLAHPDRHYGSLDLDRMAAAVPSLGIVPDGEFAARVGEIRIESGDGERLVLPSIDGKAASHVVTNPRVVTIVLRDVPAALCPSLVGLKVGTLPLSVEIDGAALGGDAIKARAVGPHCFDGRSPDSTIDAIRAVYD